MIGRRFRAYEVRELIGAGGMGEVYRAHDSRLGRDVAIKILPPAFKQDKERVARFEREARLLAAVTHPHIGAIYGVEDTDDAVALVMELVEGEDLSTRVARGALPVRDALQIAQQIADALEAAHDAGIVHRDLKPANIRLQRDGSVKVLDFGLAKPVLNHQTDTITALSREVAVAGTPAYMSPEQARGEPTGRETDIWAFGVVLYEMLTGVSPFAKGSVTETLAEVLTADPDVSLLPEQTPASVRRLLKHCLEKDARRRWHHMGDVGIALADTLHGEAEPAPSPQRTARRWWPIAVIAALVALAGVFEWLRPPSQTAAGLVRLATMLPPGVTVTRAPGVASSIAVSPDGRTLVVAGADREGQRLYVRPLDRLDAQPLAGTERGFSPFYSWDGAWIAFFADGRLKRVPAAGGAAVDIVAAPGLPAGGSWGPDNKIVFAYGGDSRVARLVLVDVDGANAQPLAGDNTGRHPALLSDGRTVLFEFDGWIHVYDLTSSRRVRLIQGTTPQYAAGHVILGRGTTLLAAPLDLSRYELTGPVVPLVERVASELPGSAGGRHFGVSRSGTLAYAAAAEAYVVVIVDARGPRLLAPAQTSYENPRFSPDGRRVAVAATRRQGEPADVWIHEIEHGTATRLTFDGARAPLWTPDGSSVTYSRLNDPRGIYSRRADGRGEGQRLASLDAFHWLVGWAPNQRALAYGLIEGTASSIVALAADQSKRVVGPGSVWGGRLSRDGRWLAYYSQDSGTFEVYVTPFPAGGERWLVAEGTDPAWGPGDEEIYYRDGSRLMAVRLDKTAGFRAVSHRLVLEPFRPPLYDDYDIHPDGRTLVAVQPANETHGREVTLVLNWAEELKTLAAVK